MGGNPANTNALICSHYAPSIPKENFSAMTRLDQNRAAGQLAEKTGNATFDVRKVTIWGNHSSTQFPDIAHATIKGAPAMSMIDEAWMKETFIPTVQKRGAAVIAARKLSSAMSAAKAACDHMKSWFSSTPEDNWVSMGVFSDGSYSTPKGVMFSFPVTCSGGKWKIVQGLSMSPFAMGKLAETGKELCEEREEALRVQRLRKSHKRRREIDVIAATRQKRQMRNLFGKKVFRQTFLYLELVCSSILPRTVNVIPVNLTDNTLCIQNLS